MKSLVETATEIAMHAAATYLSAHRLEADADALLACLIANVKMRFPAALHDAREALGANMEGIAELTFMSSMTLAGIDAAKEASKKGPSPPPVVFGYKCQECGRGTVHSTNFAEYSTKIQGYPLVIRNATIGVCDNCGAKHFDAQETLRWKKAAQRSYNNQKRRKRK